MALGTRLIVFRRWDAFGVIVAREKGLTPLAPLLSHDGDAPRQPSDRHRFLGSQRVDVDHCEVVGQAVGNVVLLAVRTHLAVPRALANQDVVLGTWASDPDNDWVGLQNPSGDQPTSPGKSCSTFPRLTSTSSPISSGKAPRRPQRRFCAARRSGGRVTSHRATQRGSAFWSGFKP
jgi:hypothetical protein